MHYIKLKNADLKVIDLNCKFGFTKQKSIHLEIYPKTYEGEMIAKIFKASKKKPKIYLRDFSCISKETQFKNLKEVLSHSKPL